MIFGVGASKGYCIGRACIINHDIGHMDDFLEHKFDKVCCNVSDVILIADSLNIKEINQINHDNIVGLVLENGTLTSHATIVAKAMGIPMVIGAKGACKQVEDGRTVIIDGLEGKLIYDPDSITLEKFYEKKKLYTPKRFIVR